MGERKLATVRVIDSILPHSNADALELAIIGGWQVVVKKGEYQSGNLVVYCEIDSWIPEEIAPFLTKGEKDALVYEGVKGNRLKTIKLRGELSQGLVLPFEILAVKHEGNSGISDWKDGDDVTDVLGIIKWERKDDSNFNKGICRSTFPSHLVPKTDQERLQNLTRAFEQWKEDGVLWEITEKAEGSSLTVIFDATEEGDERFHVCSRNQSLKENDDTSFWKVVNRYDVKSKLESLGKSVAIQGELIGPGVQGNIYKLDKYDWLVFDVYDIVEKRYLNSSERISLVDQLGLSHTPIIHNATIISKETSVQDLLQGADGHTKIGNNPKQLREGLVWKSLCGKYSFKTVSNAYLSKEK